MMHKAFFLPESPANPDSLPFDREHPWLAPLAGYSDLPFRLLCRQYGAAVCVTEMVSAKGLVYRSPGTGELLQSLPEDQPLVVQLFGAEASFLQRAVEMLRDVGYGWFDLNMGCSVAKVLKQGLPKLFWTVHVELVAYGAIYGGQLCVQRSAQLFAEGLDAGPVHQNAAVFHIRQHPGQRQFDVVQKALKPFLFTGLRQPVK